MKDLNNLVSIITPSFNSSSFIQECIESVISQTYQQWEMIIIDDCSTDNSRQKISQLCKNEVRIKYFFLTKNVGAAEARNFGLRKAKGRYIAFLDSDDLWDKEKLSVQISFMREKKIAFSFTSYCSISEKNNAIIKNFNVPKKIGYNEYLKNTIIGCLTVIIDKDKTGDFQMPKIRSSHDMALWLQIMKRGFFAYGLNKNLACYRIVNSSNSSNKFKAVFDVWSVYRNIENLPFLFSLMCFISYIFNAIKKRYL